MEYILSDDTHTQRTAVHEQQQSIMSGTHKKIAFEMLPKLNTKVSSVDSYTLDSHLGNKGYQVNHFLYSSGDLGYLPDGTVVALDKDGIDEPTLKTATPQDAPWLIRSNETSIFPYLHGTGYISKQEHFFPALVDHRVRGILSDDDIERLKKGELETMRKEKPECFTGVTAENLSDFVRLVKDEGWYPSQAQEIMHEHAPPIKGITPRFC